jgi:hypothetical protein
MTPAQKEAVRKHRLRQLKKGNSRMEINVPEADKELLRKVAANLRAGGLVAERTRAALGAMQNPYEGLNLKEMLELAPLDGVNLDRSRETGRDIEF